MSMDESEFRLIVRNKENLLIDLIKKNKKLFNNFKYLIITQGKKGCYLKKDNTILHVPCVLNTAIDSTGAGDIFLSMFFTLNYQRIFQTMSH